MSSVDLGQLQMHTLDEGQGTPLLFVHGFPLDSTMWRFQIEEFSGNCRVIAPDLRGFGQSGATPGVVSMEQHAEDLNSLLDALEVYEPVVLCGLSMGGYVAWQFWRKYPLRVAAMILCDTRSVADTEEAAANRLKMADKIEAEGATVAADAMLPKLFAETTPAQQPELVEAVRQLVLRGNPQGLAAAQRGMAARPDSTDLLSTIDVPTLIVVGEHDTISPVAEMQGIAEAIPSAAWVVVPSAGHLSPLENPAVFNASLTKFLTE